MSPRLDLTAAIQMFRADNDAMSQASTPSPQLVEKLVADGKYLSVVRRDIQHNVRRPIMPEELSAIQDFLEQVIGVISQEVVSSALRSPVSASSIVDSGYDLLDKISEYSIVVGQFSDDAVKRARQKRPTNEVRIEVEAVSEMSSEVKTDVLGYIEKVRKSLTGLTG